MAERADRPGSEPFITISVDDGYPSDLRAAELLAGLGYSATFYVPARNAERAVIDAAGVRRLGERFEVGAHTYNHLQLPGLTHDDARREIADGKAWLEDTLSAKVTSFCYPRGKFTSRIADLVADAGFQSARTTMSNLVTFPKNLFLSGATTHAAAHSRVIHLRHAALERNWRGIENYARIFKFGTDWTTLFARAVAYVCDHGGVAHLWLHSWELDDHGDWRRLEKLLRKLKAEHQFRCVTNGELPDLRAVTVAG